MQAPKYMKFYKISCRHDNEEAKRNKKKTNKMMKEKTKIKNRGEANA